MPDVGKVIDALQTVLEDPSEVTKGRMWAMTLVEDLDIETVREYIAEDKPLLPLLKNHMHLENSTVRPLARDAIAITWDSIQKYIGDVERLRGLLISESQDPGEMKRLLYSKEGTEWLNKRVARIYDYLYSIAWQEVDE